MDRTRENIGRRAPRHFRDLTVPLKRVEAYMIGESISKNFREGGRPKRWAALSGATATINPRRQGGKPLQDTGAHIKNRITGKIEGGYRLVIGAGGKIPTIQQKGAKIRVTPAMRKFLAAKGIYLSATTKEIKIPGRQFILFQPEDIGAINKIFRDWSRNYKGV